MYIKIDDDIVSTASLERTTVPAWSSRTGLLTVDSGSSDVHRERRHCFSSPDQGCSSGTSYLIRHASVPQVFGAPFKAATAAPIFRSFRTPNIIIFSTLIPLTPPHRNISSSAPIPSTPPASPGYTPTSLLSTLTSPKSLLLLPHQTSHLLPTPPARNSTGAPPSSPRGTATPPPSSSRDTPHPPHTHTRIGGYHSLHPTTPPSPARLSRWWSMEVAPRESGIGLSRRRSI